MANFDELLRNRPSKVAIATVSSIISVMAILMCFAIVWFERYGNGHNRTLVDKLNSNFFTVVGISLLFIQSAEMMVYFIGKLHQGCPLTIKMAKSGIFGLFKTVRKI